MHEILRKSIHFEKEGKTLSYKVEMIFFSFSFHFYKIQKRGESCTVVSFLENCSYEEETCPPPSPSKEKEMIIELSSIIWIGLKFYNRQEGEVGFD